LLGNIKESKNDETSVGMVPKHLNYGMLKDMIDLSSDI